MSADDKLYEEVSAFTAERMLTGIDEDLDDFIRYLYSPTYTYDISDKSEFLFLKVMWFF
jgi:hypothetical protein